MQGEGGQAGRPAIFCRFSGCNLWTGREEDRHKAVCRFCDTDFVGMDGVNGGRYEAEALTTAADRLWLGAAGHPKLVVFTGGEPCLQLDEPVIAAFRTAGYEMAVETNGSLQAPEGLDWICVSPKAGAPLVQTTGQELKLVFPQPGIDPQALEGLGFERFYLQPMDGPDQAANTRAAIDYCLSRPLWRLSVQTHKYLGVP